MKKQKLTPSMEAALETIKEHGKIIRYKGGFFAQPNAPMRVANFLEPDELIPKDSFGVGTMEALHKRGLVVLMDFRVYDGKLIPQEYVYAENTTHNQ